MKLSELKERVFELNTDIKYLMKETGFESYEELDRVKFDQDDINERFLIKEFTSIISKLESVSRDISYLDAAIGEEYTLHKNSYGRYETPEHEYSCGNTIEFKYYDDFDERDKWTVSRVEHNGDDYYIVGHRSLIMEGLTVRHRG